jgi:tetratricopeptide (TPR) repeat protein
VTEHVCPDATILAAFAEGTLPAEQRIHVERHVTDCPECPAVIGEVIRFLAESSDEDREHHSSHRRWFIAAAIAAICIPIALWRSLSMHDPLDGIRRIAAASPERAYEGRLYDFPHARFRSPRSHERSSVPIELQAEAKRLENRGEDAGVLHARGAAALLSGDPRKAAHLLKAAIRSAPTKAALWNDLAVAELARASLGDRGATTSALDAAGRAAALSPSSPGAHYNRGLVLEHLGRDAEAVAAYRQALVHEPSDTWRSEIRDRLQRLENDR